MGVEPTDVAEELFETAPLKELHHHVGVTTVGPAAPTKGSKLHDVGVAGPRERLRFPRKSEIQEVRGRRTASSDLDGDGLTILIHGSVNVAHRTGGHGVGLNLVSSLEG